jgi:hypothetical protein
MTVVLQSWDTGYSLDDRGIRFPEGAYIFLFLTESRLVLGPTQPHIQSVPGARSTWIKPAGAGRRPHLVPSLRMRGAIPPRSHNGEILH